MTLRLPSAGNSSELRLANGCFPGLPGERSSDRRTGLPGGFELPGPPLLLAAAAATFPLFSRERARCRGEVGLEGDPAPGRLRLNGGSGRSAELGELGADGTNSRGGSREFCFMI